IFRLSRFGTLNRTSKILSVSNTLKTQGRLIKMETYLLNLWNTLINFFKEEEVVTTEGALLPLNLQFFAAEPGGEPDEPPAEPEPKEPPNDDLPADPKPKD